MEDASKEAESFLLIDLDRAKSEKRNKLNDLELETQAERVFFMVQQMEAWILAQPEKIDPYCATQGFVRKHTEKRIENDALIKNKHPEEITDPSGKLRTIFRKYFAVEKQRQGKRRNKPKNYRKLVDGPELLASLDLTLLVNTFEDAKNLAQVISKKGD
jgi:hypothetical protein